MRKNHNLPSHVAFVDLIKAYNTANHALLLDILERYGAPPRFVAVIERTYRDLVVVLKIEKEVVELPQTVGVRFLLQASLTLAYIPYLHQVMTRERTMLLITPTMHSPMTNDKRNRMNNCAGNARRNCTTSWTRHNPSRLKMDMSPSVAISSILAPSSPLVYVMTLISRRELPPPPNPWEPSRMFGTPPTLTSGANTYYFV
jgi:hypothetical protein